MSCMQSILCSEKMRKRRMASVEGETVNEASVALYRLVEMEMEVT